MKLISGNYKSFSQMRICDEFLDALFKATKKDLPLRTLSDVLRSKNIYYDKEIIDSVIEWLKNQGYIEPELKNQASVLYLPAGIQPFTKIEDTIRASCGVTLYFQLTEYGLSFKKCGQKLCKNASEKQTVNYKILLDLLFSLIDNTCVYLKINVLIRLEMYFNVNLNEFVIKLISFYNGFFELLV